MNIKLTQEDFNKAHKVTQNPTRRALSKQATLEKALNERIPQPVGNTSAPMVTPNGYGRNAT